MSLQNNAKQNKLDNLRVMLDTLRNNLANIQSAELFSKQPSDEFRKNTIKESIIRCQQEMYELEKQIIESRRK